MERAARLAPDDARLVALAGDARLANGDAAGAERAFRRALDLAPDGDAVRLALGRAMLKQQKTAEAIATLGRAVPSLDRHVLLGAAYSRFYVRPSYVTTYLGIDSAFVRRIFARLDHWAVETQARRETAIASRAVS